MKKSAIFAFALLVPMTLGGCRLVKSFERDITYEVVDGEEVWQTGTVNIFNNALLPTAHKKDGLMFYRYHIGSSDFQLKVTPKEELYANAGLLRYKEAKNYVENGKVTLKPIYFTPEEFPRPYLSIGWYDRVKTSKVNQDKIDAWKPGLDAFLTEHGATPEQLADVTINPYGNGGQVRDLGDAVRKDGLVDVLLGVGNNVDSSSGANIPIVEKYQIFLQDGTTEWRYIALLNERPQARAVYDWLKTFEGHRALTGE